MEAPASKIILGEQTGEHPGSPRNSKRKNTVASFLLKKMIAENQAEKGEPEKKTLKKPVVLPRDTKETLQPEPRTKTTAVSSAEISALPVRTSKKKNTPARCRTLLPQFGSPELLTTIAARFLQATEKNQASAVLVSSCNAREGKSTVTLNLAQGLVQQSSMRVMVLDANPDNPMLHQTLGVPASPGLADYLLGRANYLQIIHHARHAGYFFCAYGTGGTGRFTPFAGRQNERFRQLITKLKSQFDYVLVDGSSLFGPTDPLLIAPDLDAILLVVECARTRWEVLAAGERKIRQHDICTLGVALNKRTYYIPQALYE